MYKIIAWRPDYTGFDVIESNVPEELCKEKADFYRQTYHKPHALITWIR